MALLDSEPPQPASTQDQGYVGTMMMMFVHMSQIMAPVVHFV